MKSEQLSDVSLHMALSYSFEIPQRVISLIISYTSRLFEGKGIITWTNTFPSWFLLKLKQGHLSMCTCLCETECKTKFHYRLSLNVWLALQGLLGFLTGEV